jgi:hypothetical protein
VLDPKWPGGEAPLSKTFFQVLLRSARHAGQLDAIRTRLHVDLLLDEIKRYWRLDLGTLATTPFDIEECLTLFESQMIDTPDDDRKLALARASFALRNLLLMYLGDMASAAGNPVGRQFGADVLRGNADVITFNYDWLAEEAIGSASGIGPKPHPPGDPVADDDLDASHLAWKAALAHGFEFDEVYLPVAGVSRYGPGERYYRHPNNKLYSSQRVLKLHGSINWLTYTGAREYPSFGSDAGATPPSGVVLESRPNFWLGGSPTRNGWLMEPAVVPPQLFKQFHNHPFPLLWQHALSTLRECQQLVVVGYSFPPTDFRTRRLFLEAFSDSALSSLVIVNPDAASVVAARTLTHFGGAVTVCDSLDVLYGLPKSWFPDSNAEIPD